MMARHRPRVDLEAIFRLVELSDFTIPFTIRAVCELGVADHLSKGPQSVEQLATATGSHASALGRALRALSGQGIFAEVEPGFFGLTPMAELLRSDHAFSLRGAFPLLGPDVQAWARCDYTLRTGEPAFEFVHGEVYYHWYARRSQDSARLDRAVQSVNPLVLRSVARIYEWASLGTLVDVGGGNGSFLAELLARNKSMHGVLIDLPHVLAGAPAVLNAAGVADRCQVVAGDFFNSVTPHADAYLLKTILHDWSDEQAATILRRVRAALRPDSVVLVLEAILPPGDGFDIGKLLDLQSLVLAGGPDRSVQDYQELFARAALDLTRVFQTSHALTLLEARPI